MQTFLPLPCMQKSVSCLDWRRLGKQRVEALQILNALSGKSSGWSNHPAVKMWRGYEVALTLYKNYCIQEWVRRGYRNTMEIVPIELGFKLPPWFGNPEFHASHRSNLLRKHPGHYQQFGWTDPDNLPYIWP